MYFLNFIPSNQTVMTFEDETALENWLSCSDVYNTQGVFMYNHFCKFMLAMHPNECNGDVVCKPESNRVALKEHVDCVKYNGKLFERCSCKHVPYGVGSRNHDARVFLMKALKQYVGDYTSDFMLYMRTYIIYDDNGGIYNYIKYVDKREKELYKPIIDNCVKVSYNRYRPWLDTDYVDKYKELNRYGKVLKSDELRQIANGTKIESVTVSAEDPEDCVVEYVNIKAIRGNRRRLQNRHKEPSKEVFKEHQNWKFKKQRKQWMRGRKVTGGRQGLGKQRFYEQYYQSEYADVAETEESATVNDKTDAPIPVV